MVTRFTCSWPVRRCRLCMTLLQVFLILTWLHLCVNFSKPIRMCGSHKPMPKLCSSSKLSPWYLDASSQELHWVFSGTLPAYHSAAEEVQCHCCTSLKELSDCPTSLAPKCQLYSEPNLWVPDSRAAVGHQPLDCPWGARLECPDFA